MCCCFPFTLSPLHSVPHVVSVLKSVCHTLFPSFSSFLCYSLPYLPSFLPSFPSWLSSFATLHHPPSYFPTLSSCIISKLLVMSLLLFTTTTAYYANNENSHIFLVCSCPSIPSLLPFPFFSLPLLPRMSRELMSPFRSPHANSHISSPSLAHMNKYE